MSDFRSATTGVVSAGADPATLVLNKPAGLVDKDVLLAFVGYVSSGGSGVPTCTPPGGQGWQQVRKTEGGGGSNRQGEAFVKVVPNASAEPASYDFVLDIGGAGGTFNCSAGIMAISGINNADPINISAGIAISSVVGFTSPSVDTDENGCFIVSWGVSLAASRTFTPPANATERWDVSAASSAAGAASTDNAVQSAMGATGTRTHTANASSSGVAMIVALNPEPPPPSSGSSLPSVPEIPSIPTIG